METMSALIRSNLRSSSRQVGASTAGAGLAENKQASTKPVTHTAERMGQIAWSQPSAALALSRELLGQKCENFLPGIGLRRPYGGRILAGTLKTVPRPG